MARAKQGVGRPRTTGRGPDERVILGVSLSKDERERIGRLAERDHLAAATWGRMKLMGVVEEEEERAKKGAKR